MYLMQSSAVTRAMMESFAMNQWESRKRNTSG